MFPIKSLNSLMDKIQELQFPTNELERVFDTLEKRYSDYSDPWGLDLNVCKTMAKVVYPLYKSYFKVRVHGAEKIQNEPYLVVSNHSGQIPIDGVLITMAFLLETENPRILRGMVERFLAGMPYLGSLVAKGGSILGDRRNCQYLIEKGESILVFPEGVKGISKNTSEYYQIKNFTHGFYRIALEKQTPILPICVIGAEEFYPYVYQFRPLAKLLGIPAFPLSPSLLIGGLPMPSPIDIFIGDPITPPGHLSSEAPEADIADSIAEIEDTIRSMISEGLEHRRS